MKLTREELHAKSREAKECADDLKKRVARGERISPGDFDDLCSKLEVIVQGGGGQNLGGPGEGDEGPK